MSLKGLLKTIGAGANLASGSAVYVTIGNDQLAILRNTDDRMQVYIQGDSDTDFYEVFGVCSVDDDASVLPVWVTARADNLMRLQFGSRVSGNPKADAAEQMRRCRSGGFGNFPAPAPGFSPMPGAVPPAPAPSLPPTLPVAPASLPPAAPAPGFTLPPAPPALPPAPPALPPAPPALLPAPAPTPAPTPGAAPNPGFNNPARTVGWDSLVAARGQGGPRRVPALTDLDEAGTIPLLPYMLEEYLKLIKITPKMARQIFEQAQILDSSARANTFLIAFGKNAKFHAEGSGWEDGSTTFAAIQGAQQTMRRDGHENVFTWAQMSALIMNAIATLMSKPARFN